MQPLAEGIRLAADEIHAFLLRGFRRQWTFEDRSALLYLLAAELFVISVLLLAT